MLDGESRIDLTLFSFLSFVSRSFAATSRWNVGAAAWLV